MKRTRTLYMETKGTTIGQVLRDVVSRTETDRTDPYLYGVETRPAKGRRKIRITIIVEPVR